MRRFAVLIAAATLACFAVSAQEKAAPKKKAAPAAAGMATPKPGPEMKELRGLLGTWTTEDTFEPSPFMPEGGTGTGTATARIGPGGLSILMDIRSKMGATSFTGHGIVTWDANEKVYKMLWVDSMTPGATVAIGHKDGDTYVYTGEMTMAGKKFKTRDVISDLTPTTYTMTSYMDDGSGEKKVGTSKCTKQETPGKK